MNIITNKILWERRESLLRAIGISELNDIRRRVAGAAQPFQDHKSVRDFILRNWDAHVEEIKHWVEYTITGESVL
jgi:hypothetical protein